MLQFFDVRSGVEVEIAAGCDKEFGHFDLRIRDRSLDRWVFASGESPDF